MNDILDSDLENIIITTAPTVANKQIDYEAAERIKDDVYVDDGLSGGSEEQVHRFVGDN